MATLRLADDEKRNITSGIRNLIGRAHHNKPFPIDEKDIFEWVVDQLPLHQRKAYRLLRKELPVLTRADNYSSNFEIADTLLTYLIHVGTKLPMPGVFILKADPHHQEVIDWAEHYMDLNDKTRKAEYHIGDLISSCTSVGQIKRLMPEEALRLIPSHLLDFSEVERRSRIPASFFPDKDKMENLMQMITLGSISPESRKGLSAWVSSSTRIEKDE